MISYFVPVLADYLIFLYLKPQITIYFLLPREASQTCEPTVSVTGSYAKCRFETYKACLRNILDIQFVPKCTTVRTRLRVLCIFKKKKAYFSALKLVKQHYNVVGARVV